MIWQGKASPIPPTFSVFRMQIHNRSSERHRAPFERNPLMNNSCSAVITRTKRIGDLHTLHPHPSTTPQSPNRLSACSALQGFVARSSDRPIPVVPPSSVSCCFRPITANASVCVCGSFVPPTYTHAHPHRHTAGTLNGFSARFGRDWHWRRGVYGFTNYEKPTTFGGVRRGRRCPDPLAPCARETKWFIVHAASDRTSFLRCPINGARYHFGGGRANVKTSRWH